MAVESSLSTLGINENSDFGDVLCALSKINPEYQNIASKRVREMIKGVFLDTDGNLLSNIKIRNNKKNIRIRVFHIFEQLIDNPYWEAERVKKGPEAYTVAATDKEFEAAERTFAKTLQEIFTRPTERLVFKRDDEKSPDNTNDFSKINIDPETITPTLLENLGLDEFIPPKGVRMTRAKRMEYMARAIPHILEIMKHLEPLQLPHQWHDGPGKYFRLMRINSGKNRGYVLGTQVNSKRKLLFKTDIHSAYRRLSHIMDESYDEELRILTEIQMVAKEIHSKLGNKKALSDEDMLQLFRDMYRCVDKLLYVENDQKVIMRDKIKRAITLGRNSGAQRAILVVIPKYAEKRKKEIRDISEHLVRDDSICKEYINEQQIPAESLYEDVERKKVLDAGKPISNKQKGRFDSYLKSLRGKIDPDDSSMRAAPLMQPYLAFSEKMVEHIDETLELNDGSLATVEERTKMVSEFMKIYMVAKIQHFHIQLQSFYQKFLSPKGLPNFNDVLNSISRLREMIGRKRVETRNGIDSEFIATPEYDDVYHKVYDMVRDLLEEARGAKTLLAEGGDYEDEIKQIKENMRKLVKGFRFDKLIYSMGADCGIDLNSKVLGRPKPQMDLPLEQKEPRDQE